MKFFLPNLLAVTCFCSACSADIIYSFGQANYTVAPGATVDVSVFLTQSGTETILSSEGLLSAGVNIFFDELATATDAAQVLNLTDIAANPLFDDPFLTSSFLDPGISAGLSGGVDIFSPAVPATGNSVFLGTFQFTAGLVGGDVTTLRATDLDAFFDDTLAGDGTILDGLVADGFATITVSGAAAAVPEPSTFGFFAIGGLFFLARQCRRIKAV